MFDSKFSLLSRLIINKIVLIIIKCKVNSPSKPSIKLAPFIINKKHNKIKQIENSLILSKSFKKIKSI